MKNLFINIWKQKWCKQNIIVLCLGLILIFSLSVGYAALNKTIGIQGDLIVKGTKDIKIIGIENKNVSCGYDIYNPKFTDNTITVNGELPTLECKLEYKITLINNTGSTMQLVRINDDIYNNENVIYELNDMKIYTPIEPNETIIFSITFRYNPSLIKLPDNTSIGTILEFLWEPYIPSVPTIIVEPDYMEIEYNTIYNAMIGITAIDNVDGDITQKVTYETNLNPNIIGEYNVAYSVKNSFGNTANANRIIKVIDTKIPVITSTGTTNKELLANDSINLQSFMTAHDEYDGNLTDKIAITSSPTFDNNKAGVYTIYYNVSDSSGNAAISKTVTITVFEFTKISIGNYHALALTSHGKVYAWGMGSAGQLGQGNTSNKNIPTLVSSLTNVVDIAAR